MEFFTLTSKSTDGDFSLLHSHVFHGLAYNDIKKPQHLDCYFIGQHAPHKDIYIARSGLFFPPILMPSNQLLVREDVKNCFLPSDNVKTFPVHIDALLSVYCKKGQLEETKYNLDDFGLGSFLLGQKRLSKNDEDIKYYEVCCFRLKDLLGKYPKVTQVDILGRSGIGSIGLSISKNIIDENSILWQMKYILSPHLFDRLEEYLDKDAFEVYCWKDGAYSEWRSERLGSKVLWPEIPNCVK